MSEKKKDGPVPAPDLKSRDTYQLLERVRPKNKMEPGDHFFQAKYLLQKTHGDRGPFCSNCQKSKLIVAPPTFKQFN